MASRGVNKAIIMGHLGKDPEVKYNNAGNASARLTIATSEKWIDKPTGQPREKTEWHRVVLFGKSAEIAGEYLRKGSQVYIEGKLQTRKWQDQSGQDRYTTEVVVQYPTGSLQFCGDRTNNPHQGGWGQPQQPAAQQPSPQRGPDQSQPQQQSQHQQPQQQQYNEPPMDFDDDIPFRDTFARGSRTAYACS
mgnify:CR=1 FL=1